MAKALRDRPAEDAQRDLGMRKILRKVAENELGSLGDTSTLLDPAVVEEIVGGRV